MKHGCEKINCVPMNFYVIKKSFNFFMQLDTNKATGTDGISD